MIEPLPYAPLEYLDRVPSGRFVLDVVREENKRLHWVALVVNVELDEIKNCQCAFPALFYVDPKDYQPGTRKVHQA